MHLSVVRVLVAGLVAVSGYVTVDARLSANAAEPAYQSVLIENVPHVRQKPDFCGEACAEMYLLKLGKRLDQDFVFDQAGLDPTLGRGCYTRELAVALRRIGFQTGNAWYGVSTADADRQMERLFRDLHADLVAGVPSILCMHYDDQPNTTEHFRLLLGYDAKTDEVIYHEPAIARGAYRRMKRAVLLELWPLKYNARQWTVVRFRLEPGRIVDQSASTTLTDADYAQHIMSLKTELQKLISRQVELKEERDADIAEEIEKEKAAKAEDKEYERKELVPRIVSDFHIVLQKPFVVIGDESPATVRRRSQGTIRWAVERLKRDYFSNDPDHVINIWLFKDKPSYEQNTFDIFRSRPHTPFGYYSPTHEVLVMNIATGGGTLVHEIVHPFMAANFPDCPSWLNEGMGSLYEQCQDNNGHIWGLTNWRLRGLHEALKDEEYEMPTFEQLCNTTTREFYNQDPGTNYSQARYLCYYLQQQGLLVKFYREFRKSVKDDPTGYETLQRILDEEDMAAFQETWTEFVLKLRF
ncbi:MAG: C39 family peptidase [Pirellulaceae bacterium]|nr:C39 family peptidase [Pirellulaceae bacterium]